MTDKLSAAFEKKAQTASEKLKKAKSNIQTVILGQDHVIDLSLASILSGGHALLVGVPGLAKTLLVETMGTVLGLNSNRVQFTPDLMPSDIIGSEVLEGGTKGKRSFRFIEGPVFSQLLMADEINRASPRTQSALLQAMQEKTITVAGQHYKLPQPFHVLATQNPIEQEGTYPLPEAQLDRFLLQINVDFPDLATEKQIILTTTGIQNIQSRKILSPKTLIEMQNLVRELPIGETVVDAILTLVRNARPEQTQIDELKTQLSWGPGPRAGQALMLTSRARALLDGRLSPSIDDVLALAQPVLQHRMAMTFAARADGITLDQIINRLKQSIT